MLLIVAVIVTFGMIIFEWRQNKSWDGVVFYSIGGILLLVLMIASNVIRPSVVTPESPEAVAMEQKLAAVKPGDLLESKDGALILVYNTRLGSPGVFGCYRPRQDGGVDPTPWCISHNFAPIIKRIIHPDDPQYESEALRFMRQMLRPPS